MELDNKEKELLKKLRQAGKKESSFTLTLKIDDEILEERVFSANKFSKETLAGTRTHFLFNDIIRLIIKAYSEVETTVSEEKKKEEMDKLWEEQEKTKKENGK